MVFGVEVGLSPGDFLLDGDTAPPPKKGTEPPPQFSTHFYCGQTAGCMKMPLDMEVGLSPEDFVLDGDPAPSPKTGRSPQFSAHVYCGQTAAWIKMPLSSEVGLGPGDIVLDGDPSSPLPKKVGGQQHPHFLAHVLWPNGWMDQDATWYGGRPRPWPHCVRWGLLSPKGHTANFRPMSWPNGWLDQGSRCHLAGRQLSRPRRQC